MVFPVPRAQPGTLEHMNLQVEHQHMNAMTLLTTMETDKQIILMIRDVQVLRIMMNIMMLQMLQAILLRLNPAHSAHPCSQYQMLGPLADNP